MVKPEEIDPDWAKYAETILSFAGERAFDIDLREPLTEGKREQLRKLGFRDTFAILTAHDPKGRDLTPEENQELQSALEQELRDGGVFFVRVDACSTDREHCECSAAIEMDQDSALAVARRCEQVAIFWYDGESFWLTGAIVQSDPFRLP